MKAFIVGWIKQDVASVQGQDPGFCRDAVQLDPSLIAILNPQHRLDKRSGIIISSKMCRQIT